MTDARSDLAVLADLFEAAVRAIDPVTDLVTFSGTAVRELACVLRSKVGPHRHAPGVLRDVVGCPACVIAPAHAPYENARVLPGGAGKRGGAPPDMPSEWPR